MSAAEEYMDRLESMSTDPVLLARISAERAHVQRTRYAQETAIEFIQACGGSVTLRALRMYMELKERSDAHISRALTTGEASGLLRLTRKADGTPMVESGDPYTPETADVVIRPGQPKGGDRG